MEFGGDEQAWNELQNMYEMGLIGRAEFEKQRDLLLSGAPAALAPQTPDEAVEAQSKEQQQQQQQQQKQQQQQQQQQQSKAPAKAAKPVEPEEDFQEGVVETPLNGNNEKTVTEQRINAQGQRERKVRVIRVVHRKRAAGKAVMMRRQIAKFGNCKGKPAGPEQGVTTVGDVVVLEVPTEEKRPEKKEPGMSYTVSCRHCGASGDHWTAQCPYKDKLLDFGDLLGAPAGGEEGGAAPPKDEPLSSGKPGRYVPPGARGGGGGGDGGDRGGSDRSGYDDRSKEISCTIRVTNLSEDTSEQDVRDLFSPFGSLQRVYLAKHKVTQESRGFAFVSFMSRRDAERAMEALQGYGYDNLILRLEWAAPSKN